MIKPLLIFSLIFLFSCSNSAEYDTTSIENNTSKSENSEQTKASNFSIQVYPIDSLNLKAGFGYNILLDGALFIHQNTIPSIPGNTSFSSKENAEKVANLVLGKLKNNIMPPSVSSNELDSLQVLSK
jgi:hypothetical protein